MEVGRKLYYDQLTGEVIVNTGEHNGAVRETTNEEDFVTYKALSERNPETVGVVSFPYGYLSQDFAESESVRVDLTTLEPVFTYREAGQPLELPKPLSVQVEELKQLVADLASLTLGV